MVMAIKGLHLMNWKKIVKPRLLGVLGSGTLVEKNRPFFPNGGGGLVTRERCLQVNMATWRGLDVKSP